jgi:hypothetical protein
MPSQSELFNPNDMVFWKSDDWDHAPCLEKIHTHPENGLTERIDFMNKVVDMINDNKDVYEKDFDKLINEKVIPLYSELMTEKCPEFDWTDFEVYFLPFRRKSKYYEHESIKKLHQDVPKNILYEIIPQLLEKRFENLLIKQQARSQDITDRLKRKRALAGPYHSLQDMIPLGGKIRSTKRHPRRKSSATKRRPRRKSSATKRRPRRTSRK